MFLFVFQTGYNVVPSISAVTGISPGRYLWRIVIAFHLGPRILIAAVYHNFLKSFEKALDPDSASVLKKMLKGCGGRKSYSLCLGKEKAWHAIFKATKGHLKLII